MPRAAIHHAAEKGKSYYLLSAKLELKSPRYGYGFGIDQDKQLGRIADHSGGFTGINSNLDLFLESGYAAVIISNYSRGGESVTQKIRALLQSLT